MPIKIHSKEYFTVAERIGAFREEYPDWSIKTELVHQDDVLVIMKASIYDNDNLISTGYAEEIRGSSNINKTSALENAETSAVGRALAFFRFAGSEIASADEVQNAISQQQAMEYQIKGIEIGKAQARYIAEVADIKDYLNDSDFLAAYEIWNDIPDDQKSLLWVAPTKGGCFTTEERKKMQSSEWTEARELFHQNEKKDAAAT